MNTENGVNGHIESSTGMNGIGDLITPAPKKRGRGKQKADSGEVGTEISTPTGKTPQMIQIPALRISEMKIKVMGVTPLIVHQFDAKTQQQIADTQGGKPRQKKAAKVPEDEFKRSLYVIDEKKKIYGIPAMAFKLAAASAVKFVDGFTIKEVLGSFHIGGDYLLPILDPASGKPAQPIMRRDTVRVGGMTKVADLRYRGEFTEWMVELPISYNELVISPANIANLLNNAGFSVGVCEWRPERKGTFGRFTVETE